MYEQVLFQNDATVYCAMCEHNNSVSVQIAAVAKTV